MLVAPPLKVGRPSRLLAAVLGVLALLPVASCAGSQSVAPDPCQDIPVKIDASWQPPLLPLKLTVSSTGDIELALTASWVSVLGTVSVGASANHSFAREPDTSLLVVRHVVAGEFQETGYQINCGREYRVFLNGKFEAEVGAGRTEISAEPGTNSTIVVVDAQSDVGPDMRPMPEYRLLWQNRSFEFPDPISRFGLGVDLDSLVVDTFGIGARDSDDADVWNRYYDGIAAVTTDT